ncbi:MAG: energy-coupling factor ABC transporter substrate-binding protein [Haloquadratum sp.]
MRRAAAVGAAVAAVVFLLAAVGGGLRGTDQRAVATIDEHAPSYDRWVSPAWAPGATAEAALFALQGGVGATVLAYVLDQMTEDQ